MEEIICEVIPTIREEFGRSSGIVADIEAVREISHSRLSAQVEYVLYRLLVLVDMVALCLSAPFLVTRDGAKICDFDYDGLAERARVVWRVRVLVSGESKATATRITSSKTWSRPECELINSGGVAACTATASYWDVNILNTDGCVKRTRRAASRVVSERSGTG